MEIGRRAQIWQPWLNFVNHGKALIEERPKTTNLHRRPSSTWRKERRRDPIQSEALDMSAARVVHCSRPSVIVPTTAPAAPQQSPIKQSADSAATEALAGETTEDTAVTPTASVTASVATRGQHHTGLRQSGVASDPAIDEHFKRSLGLKDYAAVFNASNTGGDKDTGLSVDDHFAKALGETWTKLQATSRSKDST
ncbi:hypothetical protein TKK_0015089 [Trichogramma kaykai]